MSTLTRSLRFGTVVAGGGLIWGACGYEVDEPVGLIDEVGLSPENHDPCFVDGVPVCAKGEQCCDLGWARPNPKRPTHFTCVPLLKNFDEMHCGACGVQCGKPSAPECIEGKCGCSGRVCVDRGFGRLEEADADAILADAADESLGASGSRGLSPLVCTLTDEDPDNCGGCGKACGVRAPDCNDGVCQCGTGGACASGEICCGGDCVATTSDLNCGTCGNACSSEEDCVPGLFTGVLECTPRGQIILTGPTGTAINVAAGNQTLAYGPGELDPPSSDPAGTQHTLSFNLAFPPPILPHQEVIAFPLDWSEAIVHPNPTTDFVPIGFPNGLDYVAVVDGDEMTYAFPNAPTAHVIRYWHGSCSTSVPWSDVFDPIAARILDLPPPDPLFLPVYGEVLIAPHFNGYIDDLDHGFALEANIVTFFGDVYLNAGYEITEDPASGLVDVVTRRALAQAPWAPITSTEGIEHDLGAVLPNTIEQVIANQSIPLRLGDFLPTDCDPSQDLAVQQEECFAKIDRLVFAPPSLKVSETVFKSVLESQAFPPVLAEQLAKQMAAALVKENFRCQLAPAIEETETEPEVPAAFLCAFHPVVQRVNVLPERLEFVLAPEPEADPSEHAANLNILYSLLPTVIQALAPSAPPVTFCNQSIVNASGSTAFATYYYP